MYGDQNTACLCVALSTHSSWTGCLLRRTVTLVVLTEIHHHWSISCARRQGQVVFHAAAVISVHRDSFIAAHGEARGSSARGAVMYSLSSSCAFPRCSHHPTYSTPVLSAATATESSSLRSALRSFGCSCICRHFNHLCVDDFPELFFRTHFLKWRKLYNWCSELLSFFWLSTNQSKWFPSLDKTVGHPKE